MEKFEEALKRIGDIKSKEIKKKWNDSGLLENLKGIEKAKGAIRHTRLRDQINKSETTKKFEAFPVGFLDSPKEGEIIEDSIYYISRIARLLYDMPSISKYEDIIDKEDFCDIRMVVLEWYCEMLHRHDRDEK